MPQIGWAIQVTRCEYLDHQDAGDEAYAINLVMPWSGNSIAPKPGQERGPALKLPAAPRLLDLLEPWTWARDAKWHVFARKPGASWQTLGQAQVLDPGVPPGPLPAGAIGAELIQRTTGCDHVYSISADDIDPAASGTRSLPHAVAPLTHWPAGASNDGLRMAGFMLLERAALDLAGAEEIICFPEFTLPGDPKPLAPGLPASAPLYGCETAGYSLDPDVLMASRACARATPGWQDKLTQPDGAHDLLPLASVRARAARELSPRALLIRVATMLLTKADPAGSAATDQDALAFVKLFATDQGLRQRWRAALWQSMGDGWGPPYVLGATVQRQHILARLMPSSQAKGLPALAFQPSAACLDNAASLLGERPPGGSWTIDSQRLWQRAWKALQELAAPAQGDPRTAGLAYLRAWLQVANALQQPDSARSVLGPWLAGVAGQALPPFDAAQQADALTKAKLNAAVLPESMLDDSALGLLSTLPVWDWIGAPSGPAELAAKLMATPQAPAVSLPDLLGGHAQAQAEIGKIAVAFVNNVNASASPATARPRDPGLQLRFESTDPGGEFDRSVRGYAIGLCGYLLQRDGKQWIADHGRARWISDTAVLHRPGGHAKPAWLRQGDDVWWLHETIGSTMQAGVRITRAEYLGKPICAMRAGADGMVLDKDTGNGDADGSDTIDFLWHAARELPLLGYGMHYKAVVSCIDNAGGVIEKELRDAEHCARLRDADKVFAQVLVPQARPDLHESPPQWHYRSAVPPGAPVVAAGRPEPKGYELSDETRAHAFRAQKGPVALLVHDQQVDGRPLYGDDARHGPYEITFEPPAASAEFVERWLNTDIVLRATATAQPGTTLAGASDAEFEHASAEALAAFRERMVAAIERAAAGSSYHPAVGALGIAVWKNGSALEAYKEVWALPRARVTRNTGAVDTAPIASRRLQISVSGSDSAQELQVRRREAGPLQRIEITIPADQFICVRAFSLVDERHFTGEGPDLRFYPTIGLASGDAVPRFALDGTNYRAFGPTEFWFEAAPKWEHYDPSFDLKVVPPGAAVDPGEAPLPPDLLALRCHSADPANWVRGLFVQRHEWHWTGYPVRLPNGHELDAWLASFAGVESYREANGIELQTGFDGANWGYGLDAGGVQVLTKYTLQNGARPARYAAYTARPMIRFRKWLNREAVNGPLALERQVFAAGELIAGIAPASASERLPTPPLRWTVPLTATYAGTEAPSGAPERIQSGNLLVIDDALRRTDQLARFGGIGDTIEVDLLETHEADFVEIGTNPIFHPNLTQPERDRLRLRQHAPFGLTFDNSANALVSQSAVVVTVDNGCGKWLLAKIRARRLILPETLSNSGLVPEGASTGSGTSFSLPTRAEGEDTVPLDFALDLAPEQPKAAPAVSEFDVVLNPGSSDERTLRSSVPQPEAVPAGTALRYLCSWHKQRWGGGAPAWRLQVLLQQRKSDELEWNTAKPRCGAFSNGASEIPSGYRVRQVRLVLPKPLDRVPSVVRMSDYTDPTWLTFIGSFGRGCVGDPQRYRCESAGGALKLSSPYSEELPLLKGIEDHDPCFHILLAYRPLVDITRGDERKDSGALDGVYFYSNKAAAGAGGFMPMTMTAIPANGDLSGCFAYLCSVQRITAPSQDDAIAMPKSDGTFAFEDFMDQLFPAAGRECTLRLLPEYLGPIPAK